jgi:hypothetical protein
LAVIARIAVLILCSEFSIRREALRTPFDQFCFFFARGDQFVPILLNV